MQRHRSANGKTFVDKAIFLSLCLCGILSFSAQAKQVKLGKRDVSQLAKLALKLAQSMDEKNAGLLSEISDPQLGAFFWNGECGCVAPARFFTETKKEGFFDDPSFESYFTDAAKLLAQGVAVLGKEKEEPKIAGYSEVDIVPFASVESKNVSGHLMDLLYGNGTCPETNIKTKQDEKNWLHGQSVTEIKMRQGSLMLSIFFRKHKGKFYVFHVIAHTLCP